MCDNIESMKITVDQKEAVEFQYGAEKTFEVEIKTKDKVDKKCKLVATLCSNLDSGNKDEVIGEIDMGQLNQAKIYKFSFNITFKQKYDNMYEALVDDAILFDLIVDEKICMRKVFLLIKEDQKQEYYIRQEDFDDLCCCEECLLNEEGEEYEDGEEYEEFPEDFEEIEDEEQYEQILEEFEENKKKNSELKQMPFTDAMAKRIVFTAVEYK